MQQTLIKVNPSSSSSWAWPSSSPVFVFIYCELRVLLIRQSIQAWELNVFCLRWPSVKHHTKPFWNAESTSWGWAETNRMYKIILYWLFCQAQLQLQLQLQLKLRLVLISFYPTTHLPPINTRWSKVKTNFHAIPDTYCHLTENFMTDKKSPPPTCPFIDAMMIWNYHSNISSPIIYLS